ncbi:MAG: TolC family protein [Mucinivorans sp.]
MVAQTDTIRRWTLDECIAYALEHNIEIKSQTLTAESKRITFSESKWAYAPDVSASNSYNVSSGRVLESV